MSSIDNNVPLLPEIDAGVSGVCLRHFRAMSGALRLAPTQNTKNLSSNQVQAQGFWQCEFGGDKARKQRLVS